MSEHTQILDTYYEVLQGIEDPRTGEVNFRVFDAAQSPETARKIFNESSKRGGRWRLIECRVLKERGA